MQQTCGYAHTGHPQTTCTEEAPCFKSFKIIAFNNSIFSGAWVPTAQSNQEPPHHARGTSEPSCLGLEKEALQVGGSKGERDGVDRKLLCPKKAKETQTTGSPKHDVL